LTAADFAEQGIEIRTGVLTEDTLRAIVVEIGAYREVSLRTGIRNAEKKFASIAGLTADPVLIGIARERLKQRPRLVRAVFFDKTPRRNWSIGWHQDRTVALDAKVELEGWGPWSRKDGVWHVQPPRVVLDSMVTIRLHLDPSDEQSGCIRVIPGSHRAGLVTQEDIERIVASSPSLACRVSAGDAVIMRPHVLHSSPRSVRGSHRRVVHLEYSDFELPSGLCWG
jgi:hypothetical protein